ncbi:MBL fold metallo-hydrolase [Catenuloplanes japonicus]|uniref:MBL fold metallo-hydrolase n=1 Tax=Catenuloplanes japonicus TaxID=33876 RepID=UPI000527ED1A|nr:MBL fold metallo-hydrolase [Catenuloplanes japonicus]
MLIAATLPLVPIAAGALWFWRAYVRMTVTELRPGVFAALGGGGNTLIVAGREQAVLVDTKFGPGAVALHRWVDRRLGLPVRAVVNTHFHYDHTQGNARYPGAEVWAHTAVPDLMRERDGAWWRDRQGALPTRLVTAAAELDVDGTTLQLRHPGVAHTHGDLYVHIDGAPEIVATGDLLFHAHYPFLDTGPGGAAPAAWIEALRRLARDHPDAIFVPGHGPLAVAADLHRYADYLERLHTAAEHAHASRTGRAEFLRRYAVRVPDRSILPSVHGPGLRWATSRTSAGWVYDLAGRRIRSGA